VTPNPELSLPVSPRVLLLGNPNVGKTSIFNALTGASARVGNYPGLTVERRSGTLRSEARDPSAIQVVDAPGTYSLSARSLEEQIAMRAVLGLDEPAPDLAVVVLDSGQLSRCLYLALELIELRLPLLFVCNMADEAEGLDVAKLEELLGVPCVSTSATRGDGIVTLVTRIRELLEAPTALFPKLHASYRREVIEVVDRVASALPAHWSGARDTVERRRALALWALGSVDADDELPEIPSSLREVVLDSRKIDIDLDGEVVGARYRAIDQLLEKLTVPRAKARRETAEKVDSFVLHPVLGTLSLLAVLLVGFQALFVWSEPAIEWIEALMLGVQGLLVDWLPSSMARDLLVEGVVGGVGNVLVFLPQICLLFLLMGLLEDSGYMARIAYLMDRIMRSLGLHGRAFVPMLSGFACAVPAILSTRTLERQRDRLLTMLVIPLMTCSARLPVYSLIIAALFPADKFRWPIQGLLLLGMYLFSMATTLFAAWVLGRIAVRGKSVPLLLELPPYRRPRLTQTLKMVGRQAKEFVSQAGGTILVATVILWALLSFPRASEPPPEICALSNPTPAEQKRAEEDPRCLTPIAQSYGGRLGRAIEPALKPLGFDWKIGTGILGAFAAREVFVSTLALVYGVDSGEDAEQPLRAKIQQEKHKDGSPVYTPLVGISLMVFFALASQCMSTLAVIYRETRSFRYPALVFGYMTALAYGASLLVYQVGSRLGF
jgi:ferrous iron transport protein B